MVGRSRPRRRGTRLSCPASSGFAGPATDRGALPFPESLRRGICTCRGLALIVPPFCLFVNAAAARGAPERRHYLSTQGVLGGVTLRRGPCRVCPPSYMRLTVAISRAFDRLGVWIGAPSGPSQPAAKRRI